MRARRWARVRGENKTPGLSQAKRLRVRRTSAAREARIKRPQSVVVRANVLGDAAKSTSAFSAKPRKVLLCLFSRW